MVASPPAIVFDRISLDGQRERLYAERADGSGVYRVTRSGRTWFEPRWTRAGDIAAFTGHGLAVVTPRGRVVRRVAIRRSTTRLQLSPDGHRFAYVTESCGGDCGTLWVQRLAGSAARRLSRHGAVDLASNFGDAYTWSPDGGRIAYVSADGLVVADLAGGRRHLLTRSTVRTPDWAPDGRRLLYARGDELVTSRPDGGDRRVVPGARSAFLAQWSPDGRRIAYVRNSGQRWPLFVSRPDGTGRVRLGFAEDYQLLQWSPDGRSLLLGVAGGVRFEIFPADGGGRPRFIAGGDHGDWRSPR